MATILSHIDIISKNLADFFSSGYFLDISLSVVACSIKCNRLLLAASSDYFRALLKFDENAMLRSDFILEADYLTPRGVQHVVKYVHSLGSDYADIPVDAYGDVYAASSFLQVVSLQDKIRDLVISILSIENALWFLQFATMFGDQEIIKRAMLILQNSFYLLDFRAPEFLSLSLAQIECIFLGDQINVPQESFMIKALLSWVSHDEKSRVDFFCKNFRVLLRLSMVSADEFRKIMLDSAFQQLEMPIRVLARWFLLNFGSPMFTEDQAETLPTTLAAILTSTESTLPINVQSIIFNGCQNLWKVPENECARVGTSFHVYSVGGVEDEFLMGGHRLDRSFRRNTDFFAYSSNLKKMLLRSPIPGRPRVYHAVTASHTWIYLAGGEYEDGTMVDSCERFSLVENAWSDFTSLDAPRSHHGMACLYGIIYLFGGYRLNPLTSDASATDSILTYNHLTNLWQTLPNTRLPKQLIDMAVVCIQERDMLLILGGRELHADELRTTDICLTFDPPLNGSSAARTHNASFKPLPRLPRCLSHVAGSYHEPGDSVYIVGGCLSDGTPSNEIFSFNIAIKQWSFVTFMTTPRLHCSVLINRDKFYVLGGLTLSDILEDRWNSLIGDGMTNNNPHHHNQPPAHLPHHAAVDHLFTIRLLSTIDNPLHQMGDIVQSESEDEIEQEDRGVASGSGQISTPTIASGTGGYRQDSGSSTPASSASSSWSALFPRHPGDNTLTARIIPAPFRTCYVPEAFNIINSSKRSMPVDSVSPAYRNEDDLEFENMPPRSRQPTAFARDLLAPYWLEPIHINEAMGWRRWSSTLTPTLRRVRCLTRYVLAPLFHLKEDEQEARTYASNPILEWPPDELAPSETSH